MLPSYSMSTILIFNFRLSNMPPPLSKMCATFYYCIWQKRCKSWSSLVGYAHAANAVTNFLNKGESFEGYGISLSGEPFLPLAAERTGLWYQGRRRHIPPKDRESSSKSSLFGMVCCAISLLLTLAALP